MLYYVFFLPVSPQQIDSTHDDTFTSRWLYFVCTLKCRHKLLPEGRTKMKSWESKVVHFAWSSICDSESILHHSYPASALGSWASWLLAHVSNTQSWQEIKGRNYIDVNIFILFIYVFVPGRYFICVGPSHGCHYFFQYNFLYSHLFPDYASHFLPIPFLDWHI